MSSANPQPQSPQGPIEQPLLYPITLRAVNGEEVEEMASLTLNRLRGAAMRRILNAQAKGAGEFAQALICESASIPPSTFDKLDAEDVMRLVEVASGFLGSAPAAPSS